MKYLKTIGITAGFLFFFVSAFLLFEPGNDPTGFFVYTPTLAVLNQDNNAEVGTNLEIEFITKGTKELEIFSKGDVEFLGLECNGEKIELTSSNIYERYNCKKNSKVTIKVLSKEVVVDIRFGEDLQTATNSAS